jgi:hypothetical protein
LIAGATSIDDDSQQHKSNDGGHFNDGEDEFGLTIASHAKEVDEDNGDQEDSDPLGAKIVSLGNSSMS